MSYNGWLLDTNVLSELHKPRPEKRVTEFVQAQPPEMLFVSTMTFAELRFGIELRADVAARMELEDWLEYEIRESFGSGTLLITEEIMVRWCLLGHRGRKAGRTFSAPDLILAATAMEHGLTLVTRNVNDFAGLEMAIFNPWDVVE